MGGERRALVSLVGSLGVPRFGTAFSGVCRSRKSLFLTAVGSRAPKCLYRAEPKAPWVLSSSLPRLVREFVAQNNASQIKHVIQILSQEFALSQHPHSRKGGLIGLAACSIALGKVGAGGFFWLVRIAVGGRQLLLGQRDGETRAGGPTAPDSLPALQHMAGLCLSLPIASSRVPWARERFLAWVASWRLPRRGLSASVYPLSPAAGLDSAGQVLICINGAEKRCSPSISHPQLSRLRQHGQGLREAGLRYSPNGGRGTVKVNKWHKVSGCVSLS